MADDFANNGFAIARGVFDTATAAAVRTFVDSEVARGGDDVVTAPTMVHLRRMLHGGPLTNVHTRRFDDACDALLGRRRWSFDDRYGWWPLLLPGHNASAPPARFGWHVDGMAGALRADRPERALIALFAFSDMAPGSGGTALRVGSHRIVERIVAAGGTRGLGPGELKGHLDETRDCPVVEATASAGDVVLMHAYLVHAVGVHEAPYMRYACNAVVRPR